MSSNSEEISRVRGRVFAWNSALNSGFARTANNVRVGVSQSHLLPAYKSLQLGDQIEFDLINTAEGLIGTRISVASFRSVERVDDEPGLLQLSLPTIEDVLPSETKEGDFENLPDGEIFSDTAEDGGFNAWRKYYIEAMFARSEDRISDARIFFEKSIETGAMQQQVYAAYAKMEMEKGSREKAIELIEAALRKFPSAPVFYVMKGKTERQAGRLKEAERIFRAGLTHAQNDTTLRQSLARTLADIGSVSSFKEAHHIFEELDKEGKVNRGDGAYQRYRALKNSARASRAYSFFDKLPGFRVGIPGKKDLPDHVTDLIVETHSPELEASFGLSGAYLLRCFDIPPRKAEIKSLLEFLRGQLSDTAVGLTAGKEVSVNSNIAFVVVPGTGAVRDQFMSVLSENNEALIPLDDGNLAGANRQSKELLGQLLAQYLGSRDLYLSTLPVSGRRFFGRERLLVQITDQIRRGEFIGLFGLRKMGKTSLVYQLRDQKLREEAVAYIDLQASSSLILKTFGPIYWEIQRELLSRSVIRWPHIANLLRLARFERFSDIPFDEPRIALIFAEDLRAVLSDIAAGRSRGYRRVVIVLDELERILPINSQEPISGYLEFFALLRGLAQTEAYQGIISSVVVAANALISEKASWENRENPVFALYQAAFIPPFSERDTFHMVQTLGKGMSIYWDDAALREVYFELGGHPFLTRQFCSRLIHRYNGRPLTVDRRKVEETMTSFVREEADKFEQIMELLHTYFPVEADALEQCAIGANNLSLSDQGLRHLVGYKLLDMDGATPRVVPNALRRWLRRRAGFSV